MLTHGTSPERENAKNDRGNNVQISNETLLLGAGEFQSLSSQFKEECMHLLPSEYHDPTRGESEVRVPPASQSGVDVSQSSGVALGQEDTLMSEAYSSLVPSKTLENQGTFSGHYGMISLNSDSCSPPDFDLSHYLHQSLVDDSLSTPNPFQPFERTSTVSPRLFNDSLDSPLELGDAASSPESLAGWHDPRTICPSELGSPYEELYEVLGLRYDQEGSEEAERDEWSGFQGTLFPVPSSSVTPMPEGVEADQPSSSSQHSTSPPPPPQTGLVRENQVATRRSARREASKTPYSPPPPTSTRARTERKRNDSGKRVFTGHRSASVEPSRGGQVPPILDYDAPIQTRKYLIPSSTSRKALPVAVSRIRPFRSLATSLASTTPNFSATSHRPHNSRRSSSSHPSIDEIELQDDVASVLPKEVIQVVKKKREQNTLAARKSRERKQKYLDDLEEALKEKDETIGKLEREVEKLRKMLGME